MTKGDTVRVHPLDQPERSATGKVVMLSSNRCAIAVGFEDGAPFKIAKRGFFAHPQYGMMLFAARREPAAQWQELLEGNVYVIEELAS